MKLNLVSLMVLLSVSYFGLTGHVQGEDWPMWRGLRGDGVSAESVVPLKWSDTENIRWKCPIRGRGLSSPIVVGDSVFVTTFVSERESRRLIRVDKSTGKIAWDVEIHQGAVEKQHRFNSCASSTPAADTQFVYCVAVDNEKMWVVAFSHDGQQRWKVSPGNFVSNHGLAASPVLFGDLVIVNGHQDGEAFIVALDQSTGQQRWVHRPATNLRSFSTPVLTKFEGRAQMIVTGANETIALDPANGELIWFATGPSEKAVSTPSVSGNIVFSFAGSPSEKAMAIRMGGRGDVTNSHVLWRSEKAMPYVPSPVVGGGPLHIINDAGIYSCLDPESGKILKTVRRGGNTYSSPVIAAGRVYMFEDSGRCTVIANDSSFNVLTVNDLGEETQCTPAISDGNIFVRTVEHLWCIGT